MTIRIRPPEISIPRHICRIFSIYFWDLNGFKNWMSKWIHTHVNTTKRMQNPRTTQIVQHQAGVLSEYGASTSVLLGGIGKLLLCKIIGEQHVRGMFRSVRSTSHCRFQHNSWDNIKPQIGIIQYACLLVGMYHIIAQTSITWCKLVRMLAWQF